MTSGYRILPTTPTALSVVVLLAFLVPSVVWGQIAAIDVESVPGGIRATVDFDWPLELAAAVDSAKVTQLDANSFFLIGGGLTAAERTIELPDLATPPSAFVSVEEESFALPADNDVTPGSLGSPGPEVVGIGWYRKKSVGNLVVPAFRYDTERGMLYRRRRAVVFISLGIAPNARSLGARTAAVNPHLAVTRSELADGSVFRIPITTQGVYRLDRAVLVAAGLNPDTIDPDRVRILGNGGRPLPALNSAFRYADLVENPAFSRGGGDGRFDEGDVVIFHADGPSGWVDTQDGWSHFVHPFANENAVFVKISDRQALRIAGPSAPGAAAGPVLTRVTGRWVVDFEERVWSKESGSGQDWMSNTIRSGSSRDLVQSLVPPGFVPGSVIWSTRIAIASNPRATVAFISGGQQLAQQLAPFTTSRNAEAPSAAAAELSFAQNGASAPLGLTMRLLEQINEPEAAADWVRLSYDQDLVAADDLLRFVTLRETTGTMDFRLTGFSSTPTVWDVTRPDDVHAIGVSADGGGWRIQVTRAEGQPPREIVAFTDAAVVVAPAAAIAPVPPQNLHGLAGYPDLVIYTPEAFRSSADELAEMRRAQGLEVLVATVDAVRNEFSGGIADMRAIRDLMKFLYDRAPDDATMPRYLLMFGDGHYDFRGLAAGEAEMKNWIFPYETEESLISDAAFTSDDYFGLLDDDEGEWTYTTFGAISNERVDIGVGRLTVQSEAEAAMMVDKIRRYESPANFGPWRSLYTFVADDGPTGLAGQQNDADLHLQNVDQVAELIRQGLYPEINISKIYAESYDRVFLNGFKIPDAHRAVVSALNDGTLLFNYSGHGGPEGLAQEEIFTKQDAAALTNRDRLAVFVTATCSFGWWDLSDEQSGAETLLLNPNGGAVALMTTVRLVYTSGSTNSLNAGLNRALNIEIFARDEEGLPPRLGDVMRSTKNTTVGLQGNSRKFNLLGDPSMRIGLASSAVSVDALNGVPLSGGAGAMKALDRVTITGRVIGASGDLDTSFDGGVNVTVFDAERRVPLVRQLHMPTPYYTIREDLVWRGDVRARSGSWSATFVVPKDISYSYQNGRIAAYASSDDAQALGYSEEFIVGGTSSNPPDDSIGPEIRLFLGDTTFVAGGTTGLSPELIVRLQDESGINTVGAGVGHELLLVLDGDEGGAVDIGGGFRSEADSYQRGEVRWTLTDLEPGPHTLSVRAWDVLNNSSTSEIAFVVADDGVLGLRNVYNYPNPMNRHTRFVFEHNQPAGTPAMVEVRIYSLSGRPVRTITSDEALPVGFLESGPVQILWDGLDDDLDRVSTGIYLYRVRVEVDRPDGERQRAETIERLAVIR